MKIAIPVENNDKKLDSVVSEHFGQCEGYVVLDENGNFLDFIKNTCRHNHHQQEVSCSQKLPPQLLEENEINILICKGIGTKALDFCSKIGIQVYVNEGSVVSEIFDNWKNSIKKIADINDVCKDHER